MNSVIDHVLPSGKWEFDASVTDVFEDMLERSIPMYRVMRWACLDMARHFVRRGGTVADLGCSRGSSISALIDGGNATKIIGIEVSKPMIDACRLKFKKEIGLGTVEILDHDLRTGLPFDSACVIQSVLTLQFIPIEYREKIVQEVFDAIVPGGAFILVEKVLGASADIDAKMVDLYYGLKRRNGYSEEEIVRKRLSLEGVLVPITARWNEDMLKSAGFHSVDCFWRWMNFAGWVAVKK